MQYVLLLLPPSRASRTSCPCMGLYGLPQATLAF